MLRRHKDYLRAVVAELRHTLAGYADAAGAWQRGDLDRELERLGVAPDGKLTPLDALRAPTEAERRARYAADAQLAGVAPSERAAARAEVVERAAYSWINRLLALRVMEARDLIDETLRSNPDYGGVSEALHLLREQSPGRAGGPDGGWWAVVEGACEAQAATLPGLFDPGDPAVALRPSTPALLRCVALVGGALPGYAPEEADAAFADPDAIGWAYQFYQGEAKARIDAKVKAGGKAETRAELAAKTQLFTEPYMVQWLLQNSLGRSYHEAYPASSLPETWAYYVTLPDEDPKPAPAARSLSDLTVLDPCMGSGHFLREAFDMLAAMYREREPALAASQVADRILSHHLHGVDVDPRCAQLAALTLYLRARELVRGEAKARRRVGRAAYKPAGMNLSTTPTGLTPGALERHLTRHPQDRDFAPLLEGVFAALERADVLGSLLQPGAQLDAAIAKLRQPHQMEMGFDADQDEFRRTIADLAKGDPSGLKRLLLDRVATSFAAEVGGSDVAADLFGREAERGIRLLQLLDQKYAVVVTNPPYLGSSNMDAVVRKYVERHYELGKRDLCAALILRCLDFAGEAGVVAMVTQQTWMFLRSFAELRERVLETTSISALAQLGPNAFEEISGEVVTTALFALRRSAPGPDHRLVGLRLIGPRSAAEKARLLRQASAGEAPGLVSSPRQADLAAIPESPFVYWLRPRFVELLRTDVRLRLGSAAEIPCGISAGDTERFVRGLWELPQSARWIPAPGWLTQRWATFGRGGCYRKWLGLDYWAVEWELDGVRLRHAGLAGTVLRNSSKGFRRGWLFSSMARGALGLRLGDLGVWGSVMSAPLIPKGQAPPLGLIYNAPAMSACIRWLRPSLVISENYVAHLPLPTQLCESSSAIESVCLLLKGRLTAEDLLERSFLVTWPRSLRLPATEALLLTVEGFGFRLVHEGFGLDSDDNDFIRAELGTPAGWHPLVAGYDALPEWPGEGTDLTPWPPSRRGKGEPHLPPSGPPMQPGRGEAPPSPVGHRSPKGGKGVGGLGPPSAVWPEVRPLLLDYLATHQRLRLPPDGLARLKRRLRALYEAGPGAKDAGGDDEEPADDESAEALGAQIPIPAETFLEELSQKLEVHPISVYWLLEELRAEGVRCKPEEQRLLEDRLSVLALRLLGHRWPRQVEAGEPVPDWADRDGVIPLTPGAGEPTVADRLRARLRVEDGDLGAQRAEALLQELTDLNLEDWCRRQFYARHVRQFKHRPIAWHLASTPAADGRRRGGGRRQPAFECLVYYHACAGDVLARVRTRYVQPLVLIEQRRAEEARRAGDDSAAALGAERVAELEAFAARLRAVDEAGFACADLDKLLASEPLDRWSGDGNSAPAGRDDLLRQERAWRVDVNDGVRVNVAPLQLAGVLASDVLKAADARKAIADRARWRADERRWVREGKLPRCGWMDESVPESPVWRELAPQREAEQRKLEEKRKAAAERLL